jgi:branched-subunit amino acid transport protein
METHSEKSKSLSLLFGFISLESSWSRIFVFTFFILILATINIRTVGLPSLCIWKKIFGFCPACGTLRALNAFFHGQVKEALSYNINVLGIVPVIFVILTADLLRIIRRRT